METAVGTALGVVGLVGLVVLPFWAFRPVRGRIIKTVLGVSGWLLAIGLVALTVWIVTVPPVAMR